MSRLKNKNINVTIKRNAFAAKAEQIASKLKRVPGLAEEAKKLYERLLIIEMESQAETSKDEFSN